MTSRADRLIEPLYRRARRGSSLVYALIIILIVAIFASLAVDYGMVQLARVQLAAAADAAALAGASGLSAGPAEARARAKAVATMNTVNGNPLTLLDSDIQLGRWDASTRQFTVLNGPSEYDANAVRVTGHLTAQRGTSVRMMLLSMGGSRFVDVQASAIGAASTDNVDAVLVQDVSGSFADEIGLARTGDVALLNSLNSPSSNSYFGVVGFAGTAVTLSPIKRVANNISSLTDAIGMLTVGGPSMPPISSGTDIAAGIEQALNLFNSHPVSANMRTMVIVSDGEPTSSQQGAHPSLNSSELLDLARAKADQAWANGIHVHVVFWDSENNPSSAAKLKSLVRGKGSFVHVTDPADLPTAIGLLIRNQVRLVQ